MIPPAVIRSRYEPGVDVIMVNYRTPGDAKVFIQSFEAVQYEVPCSLTVVNVDPTEEDDEVVEAALGELAVPTGFAAWKVNVGYSAACNVAAHSLGEYFTPRSTVAFFNADTILRAGVLDTCHWELHQHKDWAVCGPRQIDDFGQIVHAGIFGTMEDPRHRGWKEDDQGQFSDVREDAVSVSGSAYFVKRAVWDQLTNCPKFRDIVAGDESAIGAFLPTRHYYEETWCSYHALAHGYRVGYVGSAVMTHRWHKASPVGGIAEQSMADSQLRFRRACDIHGIPHD